VILFEVSLLIFRILPPCTPRWGDFRPFRAAPGSDRCAVILFEVSLLIFRILPPCTPKGGFPALSGRAWERPLRGDPFSLHYSYCSVTKELNGSASA